jgi:hypothetical protein
VKLVYDEPSYERVAEAQPQSQPFAPLSSLRRPPPLLQAPPTVSCAG